MGTGNSILAFLDSIVLSPIQTNFKDIGKPGSKLYHSNNLEMIILLCTMKFL